MYLIVTFQLTPIENNKKIIKRNEAYRETTISDYQRHVRKENEVNKNACL